MLGLSTADLFFYLLRRGLLVGEQHRHLRPIPSLVSGYAVYSPDAKRLRWTSRGCILVFVDLLRQYNLLTETINTGGFIALLMHGDRYYNKRLAVMGGRMLTGDAVRHADVQDAITKANSARAA
jgi:hypothetical protein